MISKIIIVGWTLFIAYAFFSGMADVAETTDTESGVFATAMFSVFFHFFAWAIVALPTYMISRMFRRQNSHA
jgi:hypothetical protein